jgi:FG-GAP-like repeat
MYRFLLFCFVLASAIISLTGVATAQFQFRHHFGDREFDGQNMGQTALVDLNGDGKLDFITGRQNGDVYWYEYRAPDDWVRHLLGQKSPSDVGGAALDVNGDGHIDFITGGVWFENPGNPAEREFVRHLFDPELNSVHDLIIGDINGDGKLDVVTMADTTRSPDNELRWYSLPTDPNGRWTATRIGPPTHSGISLGDIDGDGDLDVVRSNVWFENLEAGKTWEMHKMTEPWGANQPSFAVNATQTETIDINSDGRLDVVICDGENPNSKIAWLEAPPDPRKGEWKIHHLPRSDDDPRGALHSLKLADFNGDGTLEILTVEMERFPGKRPPRWFLWENVDGKGSFVEHVILDANLGGHETVVGDVDGDGDIDICSKPWSANANNANGGKWHFSYLENITPQLLIRKNSRN